jgi:small subunit ribosomal protein S6
LNGYESLIIFDPSCSNEDIEREISKLSDIIKGANGKIIEINRWGKKKLAYVVKKKTLGIFVVFQFLLSAEKIPEFNEYFKFNNLILRYNLVRVELETEIPYDSYENEIEGVDNG